MEPSSSRLAMARSALEPCSWRDLTPEMLVRVVVGAVDPQRGPGPVRPVPRSDRRVEPVVHVLATRIQQWRTLTVGEVCRQLLDALDAWEAQDLWLDLELAWLLEERG